MSFKGVQGLECTVLVRNWKREVVLRLSEQWNLERLVVLNPEFWSFGRLRGEAREGEPWLTSVLQQLGSCELLSPNRFFFVH